ncbi:hypothetical protein EVAR_45695_1 [Eumeta japonica]|uniref:Uncharacterized protein n=1 Tax=Eumeta variegata TaxID=151549 RepID=A0A4C1XLZ9_EUMVA|nr:hypothetical protein EVAR_45695_1 [Eumeta japonica]
MPATQRRETITGMGAGAGRGAPLRHSPDILPVTHKKKYLPGEHRGGAHGRSRCLRFAKASATPSPTDYYDGVVLEQIKYSTNIINADCVPAPACGGVTREVRGGSGPGACSFAAT